LYLVILLTQKFWVTDRKSQTNIKVTFRIHVQKCSLKLTEPYFRLTYKMPKKWRHVSHNVYLMILSKQWTHVLKILKIGFVQNFKCWPKISILDQKFRFLTKNLDFWANISISKISNFDQKFRFWTRNFCFWPKMSVWTISTNISILAKISIFDQTFRFLTKNFDFRSHISDSRGKFRFKPKFLIFD